MDFEDETARKLFRLLNGNFLEEHQVRKRSRRHIVQTDKPKTVRDFHIPLLSGRPVRDHAINADDIANLKIALATARDLDEFIRRV